MSLFNRIKNRLYTSWNPLFRKYVINPRNRRRLKNRDISILCNNCVGAVISHDLGLQFRSPFVNLWLCPKDYIKFCENIAYYKSCELNFISPHEKEVEYPVAKLDDIYIYFQHYQTEDEARDSWNNRKARTNSNNMCCLLIERDGCTKEDLIRFSRLPYPKASLVHIPMPDVNDTYYIRGFEHGREVGNSIDYKRNHFFGRRYYDDFDYVSFFNEVKNDSI